LAAAATALAWLVIPSTLMFDSGEVNGVNRDATPEALA